MARSERSSAAAHGVVLLGVEMDAINSFVGNYNLGVCVKEGLFIKMEHLMDVVKVGRDSINTDG